VCLYIIDNTVSEGVWQTSFRPHSIIIKMENEELKEIIENATHSVAYIKLIKNTKGYNWEIKKLDLDIDALEELNNKMVDKFGVTIE